MVEDKLIFPIGFDLEKGVKEAQKDVDGYLRRIEEVVKKRHISVQFKIDKDGGISGTIKRERERATRELTGLKKEMAEITRQWNALYARDRGGDVGARLIARYRELTQEAKGHTSTLSAAVKYEDRLARQRERSANAAARAAQKTREYNGELKSQDGYVSRLIKRLAVYASFRYASQFLTSIRDVTAEFELQRVSLGAIIQDQERADQLFAEIKSFALKSPLKILDLTKYTKQVAAYRIETDKLFDTTKRLADVSVGLGVDMGRLVLAYGQVKAASYLRASEIRQFTEAGIPLLELLADKFTELQGKMVSTEQVMDLVSKRAVSFSMVEQIFNDMTSAGGMFYEMQERQGNTLFGLWAKLGDAASVMYDEIGNTPVVNSGMKEAIRLLSDLMRNWRNVGLVIGESAAIFAIWKLRAVNAALVTNMLTAAEVRALAVKKVHYKMQPAIIRGMIGETNARKLSIVTVRAHAAAVRASATSTNIFTKAWYSLKAAFLSNPFGIALTALAAIATYLIFADDKAKRFKEDLDAIKEGGAIEATKSAYNFEQLAEKAVNAADGSMEQKDALDELQRTYKDMMPVQDLTIEKLKALKGNYDSLTQSIKEYVYQRNLQQQIDRIIEERTATMTRIEQKLRDELKEGVKYQVGDAVYTKDLGIDDTQISALFSRIKTEAKNTTKDVRTIIRESVDEIFGYLSQKDRNILYAMGFNKLVGNTDGWLNTLQSIIELQRAMDGEIENTSTSMSQYTGYLGEYKKELDGIAESVKKYRFVNTKGEAVERDTFLFEQGQHNFQIKKWADSIKSELEGAGVTIQEGVFNLVDEINEDDPTKISAIDFTKLLPLLDTPEVKQKLGNSYETFKNYILLIQKLYDGFVPSDRTVVILREKLQQISGLFGVNMDITKQYLMNAGEDIETYAKRVKSSLEEAQNNLKELRFNKSQIDAGVGAGVLKPVSDEEIEKADNLTKVLSALFELISAFAKGKSGGGTKSDPRLQNLKEEISLVQKLYNEYKQLEKQEGATKAAADMRKMAGDTLDMFKEKYNIDLPTDTKDLTSALEILYAKMTQLPKKVFPALDKDLKELRWTIEKVNIDESQKNIEEQLKLLADRISRTKTAKEFYDKVLGMTGDYELAANLSLTIYGENGEDLDKAIRDNIQATLGKDKQGVDLDFSAAIRADGSVDYNELTKIAKGYLDMGDISEDTYNKILKMRDEDRKDLAKTVDGWLKAIEKAKSASDKMLDLARTTRTEIDKIQAQKGYAQTRVTELLGLGTRTDEQQQELENLQDFLNVADKLILGFKDKQKKEQTSLAYEMFKDSPMYVQMFDDLDNASTTMLRNMKSRMEALQGEWNNLDPTQLKELQSRMNEIDAQLTQRNPFKTLASSIKEYRRMMKEGDSRGNKSAGAADADLMAASKVADEARKKYDELVKKYGEGAEKSVQEVIDAKEELDRAMANEGAAQKAVNEWKKLKDEIGGAWKQMDAINQAILGTATQIKDAFGGFGSDADNQFFDDMVSSFSDLSSGIMNIGSGIASGNPIAIIQGIGSAISGIVGLFTAGKVRRANKEIERQQQMLDQLEYTYGRLEKAAEKLFGTDYLQNYNQQIKNLQAQQQAYMKQAQAERSKGKKADKDKIKEYENQARDTADKIKEMQNDLVTQIVGTDVASAARDFANAWLDAYLSFGSTTDAIKEKFDDMIKNMIVNMVLAQVVKSALQPIFDMIDELANDRELSAADIEKVMSAVPEKMKEINDGLGIGVEVLKAAGVDISKLREGSSEFSGIAKNVSNATSEEINANTAALNTQNYYMSHVPQIAEHVAVMRQLMERGTTSAIPEATAAGWTDWQKQAMDNYMAIQRNTADTVVECRRAANACEEAVAKMNRIIKVKGATQGINVFLNS